MKQYLNTLYITTPESYLYKEGECVAIKQEGIVKGKIPIHTLGSIVMFGQISASPFLLGHCAANRVTVSWLTEYGRFLATMQGPVSGNVLLRREQYRKADSQEDSAELARTICIGKIVNSRIVLMRAARERPHPELSEANNRLRQSLNRLKDPQPLDTIRGIEGEAAHTYFSVFHHLIKDENGAFTFNGRSRRPPKDEINCLLSFCYTLLAHDIRSALETVGLDPAVGFLHRDRPGRPGLALDLMEEFRPYLVDRLVCTLINRGQVKTKQFRKSESGAVLMQDDLRKEILLAWQNRKKEIIEHPFLKEKMPVGLLWHIQARLMARTLRGDQSVYTPFTIR